MLVTGTTCDAGALGLVWQLQIGGLLILYYDAAHLLHALGYNLNHADQPELIAILLLSRAIR
jgi:hypothetical protein